MGILSGLEPERVLYYFEEYAAIPHGSYDISAAADYLVAFAEKRGLRSVRDSYGNVVIFADGTEGYENSPAVILQAHTDMVCVKAEGVEHDFHKDGLKLAVDGDMIHANGTTLGGDDGIGVAYMLAILESDTIPHPPLECLFTADEEVGMLGANAFDASILSGKTMVNLDSEHEGIFTCGCAGGALAELVLPISRASVTGTPVVVTLEGLKGGHSGEMIASGRASANKLMGRFLYELSDVVPFSIERISGGEKDNAIAVSAKAHLVADEDEYAEIEKFAEQFQAAVRGEMQGIDDDFVVHIAKGQPRRFQVLDVSSQDKVISLLIMMPHGLRKRNGLFPKLAETSTNLGIIRTTDTEFVCGSLPRSAVGSGLRALLHEFKALAAFAGADFKLSGQYPEWQYHDESPLKSRMTELYRRMFGKEAVVEVVHGGVECGIFTKKIKGLDVVSIGPDIIDIHTASEKLSVSSTKRVWEFLLALLAELK